MKRQDAIARYGRHYITSTHSKTIHERLGPGRSYSENDDVLRNEDDAREELESRMADAALERIQQINKIFDRTGNKILAFRARMGWHKNAEGILKSVKKLKDERRELEKQLATDPDQIIQCENMPDDLHLPAVLEEGAKLYIVRTTYTTEGVTLRTATITERQIYDGRSDGPYDYTFHYIAKEDRENGQTLSFEYDRPDFSDPEVKNNIHGTKYFLDRDAAEDFMLDFASSMAAQFARVATDLRIKRVDRAKTPPPATKPQP